MAILLELVTGLPIFTWIFKVGPVAAVLCTLLWMVYAITLHPLTNVPGPFWASVAPIWYMYRIYKGDMDKAQRALHTRYGPVV